MTSISKYIFTLLVTVIKLSLDLHFFILLIRNDGEIYQTIGEHCVSERQQPYVTL